MSAAAVTPSQLQSTEDPPKKRRKRRSGQEKEVSRTDSIVGALTRSLLGVVALFFRAPIRLYRPVKLSSWTILESIARREGKQFNLRYVRSLIRRDRGSFLPHLLGPPLIANTLIGFTLFESFSLMEAHLLHRYYPNQPPAQRDSAGRRIPQWSPLWVTAVSGAVAGSAQCIISAPLDNVRTVLAARPAAAGLHAKHQPVHISWHAVARAAVLPFAPAITRNKLVTQVKDDTPRARWAWLNPWQKEDPAVTKERRQAWEAQLKRWRGGVHGAGLVLSLVRDSVGFSSFFVIFEISRRLAWHASISVDKTYLYFNKGPTVPVSSSRPAVDDEDGDYSIKDSKTDNSYRASRTIPGRVLAAFILICGGAVGAISYELLGRPAELMREVIWQGRKKWEDGKTKPKQSAAARARRERSARAGHGRSAIRGARVAHRTAPAKSILEMRRANTAGTLAPRTISLLGSGPIVHHVARARHHAPPSAIPRVERARRTRAAVRRSSGRFTPTLANRPTAWGLLCEHALQTSSLRWTSSARLNPTPVPLPALLLHTYFIAPFFPYKPSSYGESARETTPEQALRRRWTLHNPVNQPAAPPERKLPSIKASSASRFANKLPGSVHTKLQARSWGSGRLGWALRRLATPYGIGFLAFAYIGGDLQA